MVLGGAEGIRTPDLCSAIAALSQLSYSPDARLFTCAPPPCQRRLGVRIDAERGVQRGPKALEIACVQYST